MISAMTAYLSDKHRKALFSRARRHGTSLSAEVRKAIDLYLDFASEFDEESLARLAKEANASLNRSIARLDNAIACCRRTAEKLDDFDRHLQRLEKPSPC
jgi:plasmid stability protein